MRSEGYRTWSVCLCVCHSTSHFSLFASIGKSFATELAKFYRAFATTSALEGIALKAATVLTVLALQRPYTRSRTKLHVKCLQRMERWSEGQVDEFLAKGKTIQARTIKQSNQRRPSKKTPSISRSFAKLMFQGKCNSAFIILVEDENSGGVLNENAVTCCPLGKLCRMFCVRNTL